MSRRICDRPALQIGDLYRSAQVQDWVSTPGSGRSRPATVSGDLNSFKNNTLRSVKGHVTGSYSADGVNPSAGNRYSAAALVDNWVEGRQVSGYASANEYRLRPLSGAKASEYQVKLNVPAAARLKQLQECYLSRTRRTATVSGHVSSRSSSGSANTARTGVTANSLGSLRLTSGSCDSSSANSTMLTSRSDSGSNGARHYCVSRSGISEMTVASIAATTLQHNKLEFQQPEVGDARAMILAADNRRKAHDTKMAEVYRQRIEDRKRLTSSWGSVYAQGYLHQQFVAVHEKPMAVCPKSEQ